MQEIKNQQLILTKLYEKLSLKKPILLFMYDSNKIDLCSQNNTEHSSVFFLHIFFLQASHFFYGCLFISQGERNLLVHECTHYLFICIEVNFISSNSQVFFIII